MKKIRQIYSASITHGHVEYFTATPIALNTGMLEEVLSASICHHRISVHHETILQFNHWFVICKTRVRLKENGKDNYVVGGPSFMQRWNDNSRKFAGHTFDDYKGGRMFATICVVCRLLSILLLLSVACCTYHFFAMFTMSDMEHGLGSIGR